MAKNTSGKLEDFTELKTWQEAHGLSLSVFGMLEQDGIPNEGISKARNCTLTVISNIARGFYKKSFEEKVSIYYSVLDQLIELNDTFLVLKDLNVLKEKDFNELLEKLVTVRKMTFSLINKLKDVLSKEE